MERTFVRTIGGKPIAVTFDTKDLRIGPDLIAACGEVSGTIGLAAEILADRSARLTILDAEYRNWRAKKAEVICNSQDKIAEWKVKDAVEADPHFVDAKTAIAEVEGEIEFLRGYMEGLRVKAQMIRARVDLARVTSEGGSVGYDLRSDEEKGVAAPSRDEKTRAAMTRPAKGAVPGARKE